MIDKKTLTLLLLLLFSGKFSLHAKENDFGVWLDFSVMKKFHKAAFGVVGEFYTRANSSSIDRTSIGFKGDYAIRPWLLAGAGYTWMNFKRPGYLELRERFYFQLLPILRYSNFNFYIRERLQGTLYLESRTGTPNAYYWRNRIEVGYRKTSWKLEPLISAESLYLIKGYDHNIFDEFRFIAGVNYHPNRNQIIKCYGMLTDGKTLNRFLFGLSYDIRL
jgi:hypothetical protein